MLNRRSLRVKAMQTLFAYGQCREADINLGLEQIEEAFQPDLNSMEAPDHEKLERLTKQTKQLFNSMVSGQEIEESVTFEKEAQSVANASFKEFKKQLKKDREHLSKQMVIDAEALVDHFIAAIGLLLAWKDLSLKEADKKRKLSPSRLLVGDFNLSKNKVLNYFKRASAFDSAVIRKGDVWENEEDNVKNWYKEIVKKDQKFSEYRRTANPTFEQDKLLIDHLAKQIIFKNELILEFFEGKDITWKEDKAIVRSLVTRCIRDLEEGAKSGEFRLPDFSNNWEEDRVFFEEIYEKTIDNDQEYNQMIAAKTKNWEVDRLALTDQIILKMAITEMLNFHSIPVKVTINEYIELSKNYSTPKSKQFINGVLDVISEELKTQGRIKKSGRGLIDNK